MESETVLDILRWISMGWLVVAMGWLVQIAVLSRLTSVTFLAAGLILSLFVDLGSQYARLGENEASYQLPIVYLLLVLITTGMYFYVKSRPDIALIPPFYFFIRYRGRRRKREDGSA